MRRVLKLSWQGTRLMAAGLSTLAVWTLWLLLALLLAMQLWIAAARELVVPAPLLRALEKQLASSQLSVRFGRATFDPTGRLLLENFSLSTTSIAEPLLTGQLLYVTLDPWALLTGRFEAHHLEASGVELYVPAMFSPSGRAEALVRDLDISLAPDSQGIALERLTARFAGVGLAARGSIATTAWRQERGAPLVPEEIFARNYVGFARRLAEYAPRLAALEAAQVTLTLAPSPTRGAIVNARILAAGLRLGPPFPVQTGPLQLATRFPLAGETAVMAGVVATTSSLTTTHGAARDMRLHLRGVLRPTAFQFDPRELDFAAAEVRADKMTLAAPLAHLEPGPLPRVNFALLARLGDAPLAAQGDFNFDTRAGTVHLDARLTSAVVAAVGAQLGRELSSLITFTRPARAEGDVVLAAGGQLARAGGWVEADRLAVRGVPIDHVAGQVELRGSAFRATDALLRQGDNLARGSYTMDLATRDFRFLLTGALRPPGIDGWFQEWWPRFWGAFDFAAVAPAAEVDVQGRWGVAGQSSVFAAVTSDRPVVNSAAFDAVRLRLFYRPNYTHIYDLTATRDSGEARGWFKRTYDSDAAAWRAIDFEVLSTIDLREAARLFGPAGSDLVAPYDFERPPHLSARGHLDGPGATGGPVRENLHLEADSTGAFKLYGFPLRNLAFAADLVDHDLVLDRVRAEFAGGAVEGKARVAGRDAGRQLGFDATLHQANLAAVVTTLEQFGAQRKGLPAPAPSAWLQRKTDIQLDVALSADGRLDDFFSFHGSGNAQLAGSELGQVPMLGLLSELLRFTSLRFTTARANFKLEGSRLNFPEVKVTGRNSAIEAHGTYALDTKTLDFNAKVFPFEESQGPLRGAIGFFLTPFSTFLELKLTGKIDRPAWNFLYSPGNLLRSMAQPSETTEKTPSPPATPPPAASPPSPP
ncbi:MAG TPA: AsmA-like C-terminal region-containing protein [Opitutaceae bacterium]|nr:AsmA-like C-terminal region-containing protein [Opitutaceae bacterium]